ncbi:MAG: PilZ domain-containing protein [Rhizomicrobium sp.]
MVNSRKALRVKFEHKHPVTLMGTDGTWRRSCVLADISESGAKLQIEGSPDVLRAKEFFMLLSTTGLAFRCCELIWVDGSNVGVHFVQKGSSKQKAT